MGAPRALCVGIDDYPGGGVLNGAVADARAWAELLVQSFGFAAADVTCLLDREASAAAIRAAMTRLVEGTVKDDVRVLVLAGHGSTAPTSAASEAGSEYVFCPVDLADRRIAIREVLELGRQMAKGAHLTIVLDCSFAVTITRAAVTEDELGVNPTSDLRRRSLFPGAFIVGVRPFFGSGRPLPPLQPPPGTALLLASDEHDYALEGFFKGGYRGALSWHAQRCLRSGAVPSFAALAACLQAGLPSATHPQRPVLRLAAPARSKPVFFLPAPASPSRARR